MHTFLKRFLSSEMRSKLKSHLPSRSFRKKSYSQCGEDLLIAFVLELIHGKRPMNYLDVGANHPFYLSNTALLYALGGKGVLVEPDPYLASLLRKKRSRDRVFECGVHFSGDTKADFFLMDPPTLNTFSSIEMQRYIKMGHVLIQTLSVKLQDINAILEQTCPLDFMNLDVEGLDERILEMIDWQRFRPTCVCVETIAYETADEPKKITAIDDFMCEKEYFRYADTFINTIFIDQQQWSTRWNKV